MCNERNELMTTEKNETPKQPRDFEDLLERARELYFNPCSLPTLRRKVFLELVEAVGELTGNDVDLHRWADEMSVHPDPWNRW